MDVHPSAIIDGQTVYTDCGARFVMGRTGTDRRETLIQKPMGVAAMCMACRSFLVALRCGKQGSGMLIRPTQALTQALTRLLIFFGMIVPVHSRWFAPRYDADVQHSIGMTSQAS